MQKLLLLIAGIRTTCNCKTYNKPGFLVEISTISLQIIHIIHRSYTRIGFPAKNNGPSNTLEGLYNVPINFLINRVIAVGSRVTFWVDWFFFSHPL